MEPSQPTMSTPSPSKKPRTMNALVKVTVALVVVALAVAAWMMWTAMTNKAEEETPTASVTINSNGYTPATIKISKGQDITWTNDDTDPHQIVGDQGSPAGFKSEQALNKGDSYSFTFEDTGTYYYHDVNNVGMKGVIVVQ
jgi:plastocyanin